MVSQPLQSCRLRPGRCRWSTPPRHHGSRRLPMPARRMWFAARHCRGYVGRRWPVRLVSRHRPRHGADVVCGPFAIEKPGAGIALCLRLADQPRRLPAPPWKGWVARARMLRPDHLIPGRAAQVTSTRSEVSNSIWLSDGRDSRGMIFAGPPRPLGGLTTLLSLSMRRMRIISNVRAGLMCSENRLRPGQSGPLAVPRGCSMPPVFSRADAFFRHSPRPLVFGAPM